MARILIIQDDELGREVLVRRLARRGYDVAVADDGGTALARARTDPPDLVLVDLTRPDTDRWPATRTLKSDRATRHIPVIALTARGAAEDHDRAVALGCDDFEPKPVDLPHLLAKIEARLQESATATLIATLPAEVPAAQDSSAASLREEPPEAAPPDEPTLPPAFLLKARESRRAAAEPDADRTMAAAPEPGSEREPAPEPEPGSGLKTAWPDLPEEPAAAPEAAADAGPTAPPAPATAAPASAAPVRDEPTVPPPVPVPAEATESAGSDARPHPEPEPEPVDEAAAARALFAVPKGAARPAPEDQVDEDYSEPAAEEQDPFAWRAEPLAPDESWAAAPRTPSAALGPNGPAHGDQPPAAAGEPQPGDSAPVDEPTPAPAAEPEPIALTPPMDAAETAPAASLPNPVDLSEAVPNPAPIPASAPAAVDLAALAAAGTGPGIAAATAPIPLPASGAESILVIDANDRRRPMLEAALASRWTGTAIAAGVSEGLDLLLERRIDAVVLDATSATADAPGVLESLRSDDTLRGVPVIVLCPREAVEFYLQAGADDILLPPFDPPLVQWRVARVLAGRAKTPVPAGETAADATGGAEAELASGLAAPSPEAASAGPFVAKPVSARPGGARPKWGESPEAQPAEAGSAEGESMVAAVAPRRVETAVLVAGPVGFSMRDRSRSAAEAFAGLQAVFRTLEATAARHGLTGIGTAGHRFVAVAGLDSMAADATLDAVRCGLEMVEAVERALLEWPLAVGIDTGPLLVGQFGEALTRFEAIGEAAEIALQVQRIASAGTVLATANAWRWLAGACEGAPAGALDLPLIGDPEARRVELYRCHTAAGTTVWD